MATTLKDREVTAIANVEKMGEKLTVPEKMSIDQAIETLTRFKTYESQLVNVTRSFEVFPWDGAVALNAVLAEKYGWADSVAPKGWFGAEPVEMVTVEVGFKQTVQVPWGQFALPGIQGKLLTRIEEKRGRKVFGLLAQVPRKFEGEVKYLFDQIETYLADHSIYRGKAFSIDFDQLAENGLVEPKFIDTDSIDPHSLIYSQTVQDAIETNLFTPLTRYQDLKRNRISFNRKVILSGTFGVGKTLAARVSAFHAVLNNITFIECPKAEYLSQALQFARMYEPCVIFAEDIDRETDGERTTSMDTLLNIVDGVDTKNAEIMAVFTTNAVEKINPAMIRPGRLDAVIDVQPPDALAIQKLLRLYGNGVIAWDEDLTAVGELLAGNIPAVIAEVVKRSKLAALKMAPEGTRVLRVTSEALMESAETMRMQLDLLNNKPKAETLPTIDTAIKGLLIQAVSQLVVNGDEVMAKGQAAKFIIRDDVHSEPVHGSIKLLRS